jgi:hypothetical protein
MKQEDIKSKTKSSGKNVSFTFLRYDADRLENGKIMGEDTDTQIGRRPHKPTLAKKD